MALESFRCQGDLFMICFESCDAPTFSFVTIQRHDKLQADEGVS